MALRRLGALAIFRRWAVEQAHLPRRAELRRRSSGGRALGLDFQTALGLDFQTVLDGLKLGISPEHWTRKVKGVGSGFWRVVGTVEEIQEKATAMQQQFLRGIRFARALAFS